MREKMREKYRIIKTLLLVAQLTACGSSDFDAAPQRTPEKSSEELRAMLATASQNYPLEIGLLEQNPQLAWIERVELSSALAFLASKVEAQPVIAVLDSGIDYLHPAFEERIVDTSVFQTRCESDQFGCDTSDYQYPQEKWGQGQIVPLGTQGPGTACGTSGGIEIGNCQHGTHVAGIIAGYQPESSIFGVCPTCKILPIKVTNREGSITDDAIYAAFEYIAELKQQGLPVRLINISFGKYQSSDRVNRALKQLGEFDDDILVISAAGNENSSQATFPASLPNVISVANVNSSNLKKDGRSNYGSAVDIAAPVGSCDALVHGYGIISAVPGGSSQCLNGTSMSAPLVTGVAGLMLSVQPGLKAVDLKRLILATADSRALYAANPEYIHERAGKMHPLLGTGLLNANNAVQQKPASTLPAEPKKRVKASCGTLGAAGSRSFSSMLLFFPLLLFIGKFLIRRKSMWGKS